MLLNLPGKIRFRAENVTVAGLIPTFKIEPSSLNSLLEPILKELQVLWRGVRLIRTFVMCLQFFELLYFVFHATFQLLENAVVSSPMQLV